MKYQVNRINAESIVFEGNEAKVTAIENAIKRNIPVRINGILLQGHSISSVEPIVSREVNRDNDILKIAGSLFSDRASDEVAEFWQKCVTLNQKRTFVGKKWVPSSEILRVKRLKNTSNPEEIFSELENIGNLQELREVKSTSYERENHLEMQKFFGTEEGKIYSQKWHIR